MESRIIERVKGNIRDPKYENLSIDYVDIPWYDSGKRIQKLVSKKGNNIGIRLDDDNVTRGLLQGDVLEVIHGEAIVVNIIEDECIAVKVNDLKTVAKVCYEVGNRHSPLFYSEDYSELILPFDKPILEMLKKLEVEVHVKNMKIHRDKSISSVNTIHSGHGHDMEHSHIHDMEHSHSHVIKHSHSHDMKHTHSHVTKLSHSHSKEHNHSHDTDTDQSYHHDHTNDTDQSHYIGT